MQFIQRSQTAILAPLLALSACSDKQYNLAAPSKEANANPAAVIADAMYMNSKIITVNDEQPKAKAVAIKDGKIIYVGDATMSFGYMQHSVSGNQVSNWNHKKWGFENGNG